MGLFSDLVKNVFKDEVRDEASRVAGKLDKAFEDAGNEISKTFSSSYNQSNITNTNNYGIPTEYSHFPVFEGKINNVDTKKTDKYQRCSLKYYPVTVDQVNNYINRITSEGYVKASNVRYEKNNEYIIAEDKGSSLRLVFHIRS